MIKVESNIELNYNIVDSIVDECSNTELLNFIENILDRKLSGQFECDLFQLLIDRDIDGYTNNFSVSITT